MAAICSEKCWTSVRCPDHGDLMNPRGRDAGMESYVCCDNYQTDVNTRHLWHQHDSTRYYTDPEGWAAHAAECTDDYWDCANS